MSFHKIIDHLKQNKNDFNKVENFSKLPGIYAFFYTGEDFPILGKSVEKNEIIYIGKTESSQEKRDAKTHFKSGKTGSSTVRKSIGSLLQVKEKLNTIPRNNIDYEKRKFSHFKFDNASEDIITRWMKVNLAISFYEYPESKYEIDKLETQIINEIVPILNIAKNSKNRFSKKLKKLRKECALNAFNYSGNKLPLIKKEKDNKIIKHSKPISTSNKGEIIIDNITDSDVNARKIRIKSNNKFIFPDEQVGKPSTYSLNFRIGSKNFVGEYKIGSKDGKSRSGILKVGNEIFDDIIKMRKGTNLLISKTKNIYLIKKL